MTTEPVLEFVVVSEVEGSQFLDEPYRTVIGRCGNSPIHVGDHFDQLVRFDEPNDVRDYEQEPVEVSRSEVDLVVKQIQAYKQERDVLDQGMSGTLVVCGKGLSKLAGGCTLFGGAGAARQNEIESYHVESEHPS